MGMAPVNYKTLMNVSIIVIGVVIASFGEIKFVMVGFLFQLGGIVFEATRLVMVQRLLSSAEFKMDPMVSLYYFAPICAVMNGSVALFLEVPHLTLDHIYGVGVWVLIANAMIAFLLNVSVVFLVRFNISISRGFTLTTCADWQDLISCDDPVRCPEGYSAGCRLYDAVEHPGLSLAVLRLLRCPYWSCLLQARW